MFLLVFSERLPELRAEPVWVCMWRPRVSPGPLRRLAADLLPLGWARSHSLRPRRWMCERSITSCCFQPDIVASVCFQQKPSSPASIQSGRWSFRLLMLKQPPRTTCDPHLSAPADPPGTFLHLLLPRNDADTRAMTLA